MNITHGRRLPTIAEEADPGAVTALHVYYRRYCDEREVASVSAKRYKVAPPADLADRIHAWIVLLDSGRTYDLFCSLWDTYKSGAVAAGDEATIDAMYFVLLHMTSRPEVCRERLVTLLLSLSSAVPMIASKPAWDKKHD